MTGTIGHLSVLAAFLLALLGSAASLAGGLTRRPGWVLAGRNAAFAVFGLTSLATLAMVYALVTHDFSVQYVAQVGSRETPLFYTIISLWSSLDGSILFWAWILTGYTALLAYAYRARYPALMPHALGVMLAVGSFFLFLNAWPADPFKPMFPVPENGPGPNPLLQNHPFMGLHPPLLYLGYVGLTIPFAFGIAALISGRPGPEWITAIRRWTLVPWTFLSLGIIAGAWWSYEVLGWGGYWAWDPVENASFMPWLTATAFVHSIMVQERREMLKVWNLTLIIATFLLTLLGTFLTRSGVLASVHAFTEGLIGPLFLGFLGLVLLVSLTLVAWRSDRLRTEGQLDSAWSRETAFLLNNVLFVAFAFTVLLGTLFPLVAEAVRGVKVSVGGPYFNSMNIPLGLALLFLAGVGPALPWRRGTPELLTWKVVVPATVAVVTAAALWALGVRHALALLAYGLAVFAAGLIAGEFVRPARARVAAHGERFPRALLNLCLKNRRRYGGYVVHLGVVIIAIGITSSSAYKREAEATLRQGERLSFGRYVLQLDSVWARREPHRDVVGASVSVFGSQDPITQLHPRLNYYPTSQQPIGTPAVRYTLREDLYLTLLAYADDGSTATVKAYISPLVTWMWIGGAVVGLGALFALWPGGRRKPVSPTGPAVRKGRQRARAAT
ncbi:MAG: heme lyase CcmF/NrfE family subunit [Gemmatimonadetes bacterium]|nr:heme lyase CcmF/NrfE family subunit [Gemmatimonadota bacterium]